MEQPNPQIRDTREEEEAVSPAPDRAKRLKRRILIIFACMAIFTLIAVPLGNLIDARISKEREPETHRPTTIIFCEPNYDYDIMKDAEYLGLDRQIYYQDLTSGMTVALDQTTRKSYGPAVITLSDMIDCIIAGDADGYNALFCDEYFDEHEPEDPFTMQQVYDIRLTRRTTEQVASGAGKGYTRYEFIVEYKIHKNDGTFRHDIGLDESRQQVFVLIERGNGRALISEIRTVNRR